jgi:hypothetical protein
MTHTSPSSDFAPERCQYRTATGRQCLSPVVDPNSSFCPRHASLQPNESEDFLAPLTHKACRFQNSQGVNHSLGALYTLLAQGRISPRRATALAYISSLLLRTLPAIDTDLYPHAGRPGFDAYGDRVSETDQNEVDAPDEATQTEDPTKSQKPN